MKFEEELTEYTNELFANALKFTKDEQDADDLLQDTYIRALKYKDKFTPGTNLRAWLYTIMRNTFINGYRRKKRMNEIREEESNALDERVGPSDLSMNVLGRCEFEALIADLEEHLHENFFDVLYLCGIKGKSYKEAASIINCPVGTIMSRLARARKKARTYLLANYDRDLILEFVSQQTIEEHEAA